MHKSDTYESTEICMGADAGSRLVGWCLDAPGLTPTRPIQRVQSEKLALRQAQLMLEDGEHCHVHLDRFPDEGDDSVRHPCVYSGRVRSMCRLGPCQRVVLRDVEKFYVVPCAVSVRLDRAFRLVPGTWR